MNIIFMGSPSFAIPSLDALLNSEHNVVGVVTIPDKPAGRGLALSPSAVKKHAIKHGLELWQPERLRYPQFIDWLVHKSADLFVVVAFKILPPEVFELPPLGTVNLHASLLPQYRGAAPINWAIINGEKRTGLTTFYIEKTVDTGNIILQKSTTIKPDETAGELHDRLSVLGASLLTETVDLISKGLAKPLPQTGNGTAAPKITHDLCEIDWHKNAQSIHNLVRGLSPYPCAFTTLNGQRIKIYRTKMIRKLGVRKSVGQIDRITRDAIQVQTGDGIVTIIELQLEGRRRMTTEEFLRGHSLTSADRFGS